MVIQMHHGGFNMIFLLQVLKILTEEQRLDLKSFLLDLDDGFTIEDVVDSLPDFLFNHFGIDVEMRPREIESLVKCLHNGSASSAFNIVEIN